MIRVNTKIVYIVDKIYLVMFRKKINVHNSEIYNQQT